MELRAAQLGRVPGSGSHLAQALGSHAGTSQQGGHRDHPRSHPRPSRRLRAAQPAQPGTWALQEAASAQVSRHGCYHHPSILGALSRPWAVLGKRRPSPTHVSWDHRLVWLEGDTSAQSQSHSQPFPHCQDIFPGAGQSFKAAGTIPWQSRLVWSHPQGRLGMGPIAPLLGRFSASQRSSAVSFPQQCPTGLRCAARTASPSLQDVVSHLLLLSASIFVAPSCLLNECHRNKAPGGSGDWPKHELCEWHQAKCPVLFWH